MNRTTLMRRYSTEEAVRRWFEEARWPDGPGRPRCGVEDHNRGLSHTWSENGQYRVEVGGRYRHSVSGAVVGDRRGNRLVSRLTYEELPDAAR